MRSAFLILRAVNTDISRELLNLVEAHVGDAQGDVLFLVIESYGGDPLAAVQIIRFLQGRFGKINIIVPDFAMSAATLMALGGDAIYMQRKSVLGPLDLQVEHPKGGNQISILDIRDMLYSFNNMSQSMQADYYSTYRKQAGLSRKDAIALSIESVSKFFNPILEQIDPIYLQKALRETQLSYSYGEQLLSERMMKDNIPQVDQTLTSLISNFTSHGYGISPKEAREDLKLNIQDLDTLSEWAEINKNYSIIKLKNRRCDILFKEINLLPSTDGENSKPATKENKPEKKQNN